MRIGIGLSSVNPRLWSDVAEEADRLGYESLWIPEHLVFPVSMSGSPDPKEDHPPVPPETPVYDVWNYLSFLAARTRRIRLGASVYNLGLRHPFVSARAIATLDIVSGGRAEAGVGASWLKSEWDAVGLDFHTRGARMDESLELLRRLWSEDVIEHHGRFFDFDPVRFEPKPIQQPLPISIGGVSEAGLRRAARHGDGWIAMPEDVETVAGWIRRLRELRAESDRAGDPLIATAIGQATSEDDLAAWEDAGVDRLVVSPWSRSREAIEGLRRFVDVAGDHLDP